jgi:hypothetical protein
VHALVDRESNQCGSIGRGEGTASENISQRAADLAQCGVGGQSALLGLFAQSSGDGSELVRDSATFEVAPYSDREGRLSVGRETSGTLARAV